MRSVSKGKEDNRGEDWREEEKKRESQRSER